MIWLRKWFVHLLSSLLFVTLLTGVIATGISIALAHPNKLEAWLNQSGLSSSFINMAIEQAKSSTGGSGSSNGISLTDAAVQQAAQSAFPPALLQQNINIFLNSNYAWLEGKISKPSFVIDLTTAKQTFAQQVGQYATSHLASLPVCTYAQAIAMQNLDPLTATCRPASINAASEGSKVAQEIASGTGFLSNPIITADTISPSSNGSSQAYYTKFSFAPKIYQWAAKSPLIIAGAALLSALGIVFLSSRKRKGLRRVGIILASSGAILIATRFVADVALKRVETQVFNNSNLGDLQQSLTTFIRLVESQIVKIDLYFGIAFVVLAIAIFVALFATSDRVGKAKPAAPQPTEVVDDTVGNTDLSSKTSAISTPISASASKTPKHPRLVQ